MSRPIARFHNTFRIVYTMIFGSLRPGDGRGAPSLRAAHRIQGELKESTAGWTRGAHYEANEIGALRWVFATLVESAEIAYDCALGPLEAAEREQYYAESKTLAALFGLPASALPENWEAFAAYNRAMHASAELGVSSTARSMAHNLLSGAGSWIPIPSWYRALTTGWMPSVFATSSRLRFADQEQRSAEQARERIPRLYRKLPPSIRFVGPWHQAQARLPAAAQAPSPASATASGPAQPCCLSRTEEVRSSQFAVHSSRPRFTNHDSRATSHGSQAHNRRNGSARRHGPRAARRAQPRLQRAAARLPRRVRPRPPRPVFGIHLRSTKKTAGRKRRGCAELAVALQSVFAQQEQRNALCDEFLDLCSIHGESHPGERKLARTFLERIERGEVGAPTEEERKPW